MERRDNLEIHASVVSKAIRDLSDFFHRLLVGALERREQRGVFHPVLIIWGVPSQLPFAEFLFVTWLWACEVWGLFAVSWQ